MASLKDISLRCGVSVATVSKALNDHKDISEETRNRVRQVAKEMGYSPNLSARALKTNKTHGIGVLFVDDAGNGLTHDFFAGVLDSFKRAVEDAGYDITFISCSSKQPNPMTFLEHSKYHGFDGVVLACIDFTKPEVIELVQSDIPVVTIDHVFNNRMAVVSDNVSGMAQLVTYVAGRGHKKIAYIHGAPSSVTSARIAGFYRTVEKLGLTIPDEYIVEAPYRDSETSFDATMQLLDLPDPPTCILYPDDFAALGGINAIRERGLRIPEDISVAGYDGLRLLRHLEPRLTTLVQDAENMGATAANELINLIERPRTTIIEQKVITGKVYEGRTVKDISKNKK